MVSVWHPMTPDIREVLEQARVGRPCKGWGSFACRAEACLQATISGEIRRLANDLREPDLYLIARGDGHGLNVRRIAQKTGLPVGQVVRILREFELEEREAEQ